MVKSEYYHHAKRFPEQITLEEKAGIGFRTANAIRAMAKGETNLLGACFPDTRAWVAVNNGRVTGDEVLLRAICELIGGEPLNLRDAELKIAVSFCQVGRDTSQKSICFRRKSGWWVVDSPENQKATFERSKDWLRMTGRL